MQLFSYMCALIMGTAETLCSVYCLHPHHPCVGKHVLHAILAVQDVYHWAHLESVWGGTLTCRVHSGAVTTYCQY